MEYVFSFFVHERSPVLCQPPPRTAWEEVCWAADGCSTCPHPPPLADLARWAPHVFTVQLQLHRNRALGCTLVLAGRVFVHPTATLPLPDHVRVVQLLQASAGCIYVDPAPPCAPPPTPATMHRHAPLWLPRTVPLGVSTGMFIDFSTGFIHPMRGFPAQACALHAPRGGVLTVRGTLSDECFKNEVGSHKRVLIITRPVLVPQWERRLARTSVHALIVTYHDIENFVQTEVRKMISSDSSHIGVERSLDLLLSLYPDYDHPLMALWRHPWDRLWMDEDSLLGTNICYRIYARWTWILRSDVILTHRDARAHARQLGVPGHLLSSPWFIRQWLACAMCFDTIHPPTPANAIQSHTTPLHLPREWHADYAAAGSTLRKLAVCSGVSRPPHFRLCASPRQALVHRKRQRNSSASFEYFRKQVEGGGTVDPTKEEEACPVCWSAWAPPAAAAPPPTPPSSSAAAPPVPGVRAPLPGRRGDATTHPGAARRAARSAARAWRAPAPRTSCAGRRASRRKLSNTCTAPSWVTSGACWRSWPRGTTKRWWWGS